MMMRFKMTLMFSLLILALPEISWSNSLEDNPLPSYRITAGITIYSTDFDIYDKGSSNPNGTLSEEFSYAPSIIIGSPYNYFADSNWASSIEYSFSTFKLSQQLVNDELVDLGTSVEGYYAFITPTLVYSFTDAQNSSLNNYSLITGLGVGIGYLEASGDIIFTETTQQQIDFDISGAALAISLFIDYRIGDYITRISGGLTSYSQDDFEYDSFGFSMDFGFIFEL